MCSQPNVQTSALSRKASPLEPGPERPGQQIMRLIALVFLIELSTVSIVRFASASLNLTTVSPSHSKEVYCNQYSNTSCSECTSEGGKSCYWCRDQESCHHYKEQFYRTRLLTRKIAVGGGFATRMKLGLRQQTPGRLRRKECSWTSTPRPRLGLHPRHPLGLRPKPAVAPPQPR